MCGSPSYIRGDGPRSACWPCIYRIGAMVAHPELLTQGEAVLLLEAHGDVVELQRKSKKDKVSFNWHWIEPEPTAEV